MYKEVLAKFGRDVLKVGLTGGMSSGKSVVGEMFVELGAHLIQSDLVGHQLMQPGEPVYEQVVNHFGAAILNPDKSVNRARLAEAAFGQPSRIEELNRIVHPAVIERENQWMAEVEQQEPHAIVIVEAALILEARAQNRFHRLLVVTCRPEQRIERWALRSKVDLESARREVTRRMAAQMPDEQKIKAADYLIDNSGSLTATRAQVEQIYIKLRAEEGRT
jgi:dephospho-CoA kinase